MALTIESKISELLANESAKAILDKHCPGMTADPRLKMAMGMTLKQIVPLSQGKLNAAKLELVAGDLAKL